MLVGFAGQLRFLQIGHADDGQRRKKPQQFLFIVAKDLAGIPLAGQAKNPGGFAPDLRGTPMTTPMAS